VKLKGRILYRDLEGGTWVLVAEDGRTYQLAGGDRKLKQDGRQVEVEGQADEAALTAQMVGPVFRVQSYRFL
jgi:hypothetical protein